MKFQIVKPSELSIIIYFGPRYSPQDRVLEYPLPVTSTDQKVTDSIPGYVGFSIHDMSEAFNRRILLLTSKLSIKLRKKLVRFLRLEHCFIWLRDLDTKKIRAEVFGEL